MRSLHHILAGAHDLLQVLQVLQEDGQANLLGRVAVDAESGSGASRARRNDILVSKWLISVSNVTWIGIDDETLDV